MVLLLLWIQDPVQDPASGWREFGPGSWVRVRTVTKMDEKTEVRAESRLTLLERTKDVLVFEQETTVLKDVRRERREVPIKPKKGPILKTRELSQGEEEIAVGSKTLKCRWVENEVEAVEGGVTSKSVTRVWIHPEIPGGVARMKVKVLAPQPFEMELETLEYARK